VDIARLTENAVDVLPEGALEEKLKSGRPLRVKLGVDPTSPDLHLGFAYALENLRRFQEEGHEIVLIVGDYTARIGDPSGRSAERPVLPDDVLDANAKEFARAATRIIDPERTTVRFNGEWLGKLSYAETVRLCRTMTVARLLERDDFAKRFAAQQPISVSELLYPIMQGYDSVAVEADVELGGTDQLYNLLAGRDVMQAYGLEPQVVITYPLLIGLDGADKMSKSKGNYVAVQDPPEEMFGKVMSIPDALLPQWWEITLRRPAPDGDPFESKLALARGIVAKWHGPDAAVAADEHFARVVRRHEAPDDVPEERLPDGDPIHLPALLANGMGIG
jgi:tyrosyl-tRNA synthetase